MFIEVTSQEKMPICREIMEKLVREIFNLSIGTDANLVVEQVKVFYDISNYIQLLLC
jgi:hypothetical protein